MRFANVRLMFGYIRISELFGYVRELLRERNRMIYRSATFAYRSVTVRAHYANLAERQTVRLCSRMQFANAADQYVSELFGFVREHRYANTTEQK